MAYQAEINIDYDPENAFWLRSGKSKVSSDFAKNIGDSIGIDWNKIDLNQFQQGLEVELEHKDVTFGDMEKTGKIALAHLKEVPDYYSRLKIVEKEAVEDDYQPKEEKPKNQQITALLSEWIEKQRIGLMPKKVDIHLPSGKTVQGIRYVRFGGQEYSVDEKAKKLVDDYHMVIPKAKDIHEAILLANKLFSNLRELGLDEEEIDSIVNPEGHERRKQAEISDKLHEEQQNKAMWLSSIEERMNQDEETLESRAQQWGKKNFGDWLDSLTDFQKDVIHGYTNIQFAKINRALRSGDVYGHPDIGTLDRIFKKVHMPMDVIVYRGIVGAQFEEGQEFVDKGFVSTSLLPQVAMRAGQLIHTEALPTLLEIKVRAGNSAAYVGNINENAEEAEVLLARGQKFKVNKVNRKNLHDPNSNSLKEFTVISAEVIEND